MSPASAPPSARGPRPREVSVLAGLVLVEALVLAVVALRLLWTLVFEEPLTVGGTVFLMLVTAAGALWLLRVGSGLRQGFRWPRAAALVVQLFLLVVALPLLRAGQWAGLVPAVPAVVVLVLLFRPAVLAWTTRTVR